MASGRDVRETFARMAMNDYETVALIAGGHTFGRRMAPATPSWSARAGGRADGGMGFGWINKWQRQQGGDTTTSGIEGAWKPNQRNGTWAASKVLFKYEWELVRSPAGASSGARRAIAPEDRVVDAHDPSKKHAPMMTTADLSLKFGPAYERSRSTSSPTRPGVCRRLRPRAWFKLTHRDMGPKALPRPEVPAENPDLARPVARRDAPADRWQGCRGAEGAKCSPAGSARYELVCHCVGLGVYLPWQ